MRGGRVADDSVLSYIREHILLRYTSLSLEQIRDLDMYDFEIHGQLAMIFQAAEQGAFVDIPKKAPTAEEVLGGTGMHKGGGSKTTTLRQRFDPNIGDFVNT